MNRLVVKPEKGYMKIAIVFFIYAITFFVLIMTVYAPSHDDTLEFILAACVLPVAVGMIPTIIYRNVKMIFDNDGVVSSNILGMSRRYSWQEITEVRLLNDIQYQCRIYANGQKVGSAIFSYDGYAQMLDFLVKKRMLENSDIVEKAKRRAAMAQLGGLLGAFFKNKQE